MTIEGIPGIYVHDTHCTPYATAIAQGIKPIETRTRDVLGRFVGEKVLIIRTRNGHPADVVGQAVIASKRFYSASELDDMRDQTLIPPGSKYDCQGRGKWGYTMTDQILYSTPIPLSAYTIISKTRSYAILTV